MKKHSIAGLHNWPTLTGRLPSDVEPIRIDFSGEGEGVGVYKKDLPAVVLEADYSAIELRILAHLQEERKLAVLDSGRGRDDALAALSALAGLGAGMIGERGGGPASGRDRCSRCGRTGAVRVEQRLRAGRRRSAFRMLCGLHGGG